MREVVEVVEQRIDAAAARAPPRDRTGHVADEVDEREREGEAPPAHLRGVLQEERDADGDHGDVLQAHPPEGLVGVESILGIHQASPAQARSRPCSASMLA